MKRIDAHQHFWKFELATDSCITDEVSVIQKDFLPDDLKRHLQQNSFEGRVAAGTVFWIKYNSFL